MLWNDLFQCQIPHIDAQHKALFDHIDKLGAMQGDVSRIPETIEFLDTYVTEHFADEESLHQQIRYPNALEHQREHQSFLKFLRKLKEDYNASGHNLASLMEMNTKLVEWLKNHILQADKKYAAFFHSLPDDARKGIRLPHRPWIPEGSQEFYRRVTGIKPGPSTVKGTGKVTRSVSSSWSDTMLCGIPLVDEQHKELFRQLDILRDRGNSERVPAVIRFLADYVVKHFNDEESLHLRSQYPQAAGHRKLHADFIKTFGELKTRLEQSGGEFAAVMELNRVVFEWLREHVMKVDKQFGKFYQETQATE